MAGAFALLVTSAAMAEGEKHGHDHDKHETEAHASDAHDGEHKDGHEDHDGHEDEAREHAAHEHGSGALNVVFNGGELAVELRMPGVNVVGFEHSPESDEDKAAVEEAVALFRDPARLYTPNTEAGCSVEHGEASFEFEGDGHSELLAVSHFVCTSPERLREMTVTAFDHLDNVEALDAQVVTEQSQGGAELSPSDPVLRFGGS